MQITGFTAEHHYNNSHVFQMDNMDFMRQIPDKYFDLGVVDPPYGIGASKKKKYHAGAFTQYKGGSWDAEAPKAEYFKELFRVSKYQIIWGANYFTKHLPAAKNWIVWDKSQPLGISLSMHELAFCNIEGQAAIARITSASNKNNCVFEDQAQKYLRIHPTQKPVALYSWIFDNYAKPGWRILDTHLGSQSSRIAAYKKGFEFWATELDPDYFSEGNARFMNAVKMPLFQNLPPEQLQMW